MTAALEGGEWSAARPGRTLPLGKTRYPFYRRLGEPQDRFERAEKSRPLRDSIPDCPARSQSLYRLSYPAHKLYIYIYIYILLKIIWANSRIKSHLLALLGAHHILHVSRVRVNTSRLLKGANVFLYNVQLASCGITRGTESTLSNFFHSSNLQCFIDPTPPFISEIYPW